MADTVAAATQATVPAAASSPKKSKVAVSKKPRTKPAHPRTSEMVNSAIGALKERGGSSLQAIKKYMAANYKVDSEKLAPFIKKYLKGAVTSGELVQTKGKGASGSFKLASASKPEKPAVPAKRAVSAPKEKKLSKSSSAKKATKASPKKMTAVSKRAATEKKRVAPKPKKSPSKVKKVSRVPTKKPKAPKPKKVNAKSKSPKKTLSSKRK